MAWYKLDEEGNIEGLFRPLAPLINYVARLNGTDQYWQLSESTLVTGSDYIYTSIEVYIGGEFPSSNQSIIGGSGGGSPAAGNFTIFLNGAAGGVSVQLPRVGQSSTYFSANGDFVINSFNLIEFYSDENNLYIRVNGGAASQESRVEIADFSIDRLGTWGSGLLLGGILKDFKMSINNVNYEIPLTNKAQGATQLATVGNVNATMVGYTPDVWEVDTQ